MIYSADVFSPARVIAIGAILVVALTWITDLTQLLFTTLMLSGFHEGVADIVSLSFQTPEHLKKIGLLDEVSNSTGTNVNKEKKYIFILLLFHRILQ